MAQASDVNETTQSDQPVRVLLVEDDVDHAQLVRRALRPETGFEVVHVRTGARALEARERESFDVFLVDHRLPDRGGISVCQAIREDFDGPVLLVTSVASDEAVEEAFQAGVDDYLVKGPGLLDRLPREVRRHLGARA